MRIETYKRLVGILKTDIAKLEAKINHDRFADWRKLNDELNQKAREVATTRNLGQQGKLLIEAGELEKKTNKAWKVLEEGHKNIQKWFDEQLKLESDLASLQRNFHFTIR
jgi:CTP-dependent riboflavin kinase